MSGVSKSGLKDKKIQFSNFVFLNFLFLVKELVNSDCRFGFLVKNCIYRLMDRSGSQETDENPRN